jgi:hypothetical protein
MSTTIGNEVNITNWPSFGTNPVLPATLGVPQVNCDTNSSVAEAAVRSVGLQMFGTRAPGGDLGSLDIKRMDVKTAISMSLMHEFVQSGRLYELVADTTGSVEFVEIGAGGGSLYPIYYTTQTTSFSNPVSDVLVTGGKPLPEINYRGWYNVLSAENKEIYDNQDMLENCRYKDFCRYATIVYKDPHMDTTYKDGIDNIYNINNPWERLVGYVHYKNPGTDILNRTDVKIDWSNTSNIPYRIHDKTVGEFPNAPAINMGNIQEIYNYNISPDSKSCFGGKGGTGLTGTDPIQFKDGVKVTIPSKWRYETVRKVKQDKLTRISGVYLIGMEIELLFYAPREASKMFEPPSVGNSVLWVSISRTGKTTYKCEEGRHYAIATNTSSTGEKEYAIVFAKETRNEDPFPYGQGTKFRVDPFCNLARSSPTPLDGEYSGTIFPTTKTTGILVNEIWITYEVETPCINIFDPEGGAKKIADGFEYKINPVTVIDKPTPIANKSSIIDQAPDIKDNDPTTAQSFIDTPMEKILNTMQGAGMSVSWSFLQSERETESAAKLVYDLMSDTNVETVFTCGPTASPVLGAGAFGGVVNAIRYSYTDQSSYTISVTVGPKLPASSIVSVDGGPSPKMAEDTSAKGVVVASAGDNVNFKVRMDGYGEKWAVCMTTSIIRVGDVVQCSIHNNPVEA